MALHDLFALAVEAGEHRRADRLAKEAFDAYENSDHPGLFRLAHDVARDWLARGDPATALPVLLSVLPMVGEESERVTVLGNIARAAGEVGDLALLSSTAVQIQSEQRSRPDSQHLPDALLGLARGFSASSMPQDALAAARLSLELAVSRGEVRTAREAAMVANQLRHEGGSERASRRPTAERAHLASQMRAVIEQRALAA
jgi:hypothetical protein